MIEIIGDNQEIEIQTTALIGGKVEVRAISA
jgi:hypothetical protein